MINCVYRFIGKNREILYIGKANNHRLNGHIHGPEECDKRTELIQIRVTKSENDELNKTVLELKEKGYQPNINASVLVRHAVKMWISIDKKLEEGNALHFIPISKEIIDNKRTILELEELSKDEKLSDNTRKILAAMSDGMEWEVLSQLKVKYSENNGFFEK